MPNEIDIVASLAGTIDDVLSRLVLPGARCALLDFPNHANVGDSAIWLGETAWLRQRGAEVVYACDLDSYSRPALTNRIGDGIILLHGGGNLGDFWSAHQKFRERVIRDFPKNRIIQLPQTIYFMDQWGVGEAQRAFDGHRDFTLLCRDRPSLEFARREFAGSCRLCPDMAFALNPPLVEVTPDCDVLWLARTDAESQGTPLPPLGPGEVRADWLEEPATPLTEQYRVLSATPARAAKVISVCDALAAERLRRGCELLRRGRVVVTDRLHGHILCLILGIPHVLLDNSYGKLTGFFQTWTRESLLAHWAASPAEALDTARRLAAKFEERARARG